ncbi:MAG: hypothetical protein ABR505_12335 [Actinomycetota bacterium]
MDDERPRGKAGPVMEEVLRRQAEEHREQSAPPAYGTEPSSSRTSFVLFVCGSFWIATVLIPLRVGEGLTWLYVMRMTLVIVAVAIPMLLVTDRTLWASKRRWLSVGLGGATGLGWSLAALLYILVFVALFEFMDLFW